MKAAFSSQTTTELAGTASSETPSNAPEQPTAQACSDLELVRLWLSEKSEHTQRAYQTDLEEFIDRVDKPIQAILLKATLLKDVQVYKAYPTDERARDEHLEPQSRLRQKPFYVRPQDRLRPFQRRAGRPAAHAPAPPQRVAHFS